MFSIKRESPASEILVFPKFTFHARWLAGLSRQTAATRLDQLALFIWTEDVCHANTGLHYMLFFLKWITFLPFHPLPAQQTPTQSPRLMDSLLKSSLFNLPPPELRSTLLILSQPFAHPSIILHFTLLNLCLFQWTVCSIGICGIFLIVKYCKCIQYIHIPNTEL